LKGKEMINILDVIVHGSYNQISIIIDKMPKFLHERRGKFLFAEDDGFYSSYCYQAPSKNWKAFAGRKFDIAMLDGTVEHAHGQWWYGGYQENVPEEFVHVGYCTLEALRECYVFIGGCISKKKLEDWLNNNTPGSDYWKYDSKRQGGDTAQNVRGGCR
jgi:hypothetical protein